MDPLPQESIPRPALSRKRKADSQDSDNSDPAVPPPDSPQCDRQPLPARRPAPAPAPHRLSLETASNSAQGSWFTSRPATSETPLVSPSTPSSTPPESPSRAKRPRIDTAQASSKASKRAAIKRAQELITALQASAGNWHWETSPDGDTRLVAPIPSKQGADHQEDTGDFSITSLSPGGLSPSASRIVIPIDPCSPHIPIRHPPINKETLKELDLDAIMRNPQLRHDFLFDSGLQFRAAATRRKREQAETYWRAVRTELESGCTCVTFDTRGRPHSLLCVCKRLPDAPSEPVIACMPLRRKLTLRMPSRIKPLLQELLHVLLSIIRPQTSVPPNTQGGAVSFQQRLRQHQEQTLRLQAVLDADLILQEMKHGVYDLSSSFEVIGEVLKSHCAPMRDGAVDAMVALANKCSLDGEGTKADAVQAMRSCFEILELMKLDIANHQMQTLRPYIIHSSPEFELRTFKERHAAQAQRALTEQWLVSAHRQLEVSDYKLVYPQRVLSFRTLSKRTRVILSSLKAIIDLIFSPPSPVPLTSPLVTTTAPTHHAVPPVASLLSGYPESLYLDHSRLILLAKDASDLSTIYMLLMLYRQLLFTSTPKSSPARGDMVLDDAHLQGIKKELWELGPQNLGRCFLPAQPMHHSRSSQNDEKEQEEWNAGIKSVVLQVTARASEARQRPSLLHSKSDPTPAPMPRAPDQHLLTIAESWADSHLRIDSPLSKIMRERLRDAVFDLVVSMVVLCGSFNPALPTPSTTPTPLPEQKVGTATGLEPLSAEIRQLGERLAKLAVLHLNVYQTLYEESGIFPEW